MVLEPENIYCIAYIMQINKNFKINQIKIKLNLKNKINKKSKALRDLELET